MPFTYAENGEVVGFAGSRKKSPRLQGKVDRRTRKPEEKGKVGKMRGRREREGAREKRSLSARSSEKASVERQGANEIVGYVLSTTA